MDERGDGCWDPAGLAREHFRFTKEGFFEHAADHGDFIRFSAGNSQGVWP